MTKAQCDYILQHKDHELYPELSHKFRTNYNACRKYYDSLGYKGYTLHHKILNCTNYEDWVIDEIQPMTRSEHSRLHMCLYKQGLGSEESKRKAHETLRKMYDSGELVPWNKGLTKETSPILAEFSLIRKGKTGDDFPFLRASKKGKTGGWNRGITSDDPRYQSLLHSEEWKLKHSEYMQQNNPMSNPESRKKVGDSKRGKKRYTNGVETHIYFPGQEPEGYIPTCEWLRLQRQM